MVWGICGVAGNVLDCCGEDKAELQGQALNLPVCLRSDRHLWSRALGSDWKDKITDTSGCNEVSPVSGWAQP